MNVKTIVIFCWQHELDILRAVEEKRMDCTHTAGGGNGHCRISDPTALKAINNISDVLSVSVDYGPCVNGNRNTMLLRRPLQWLKVASWTRAYYKDKPQGRLIDLKYKQSILRNEICESLGISQATYYTMLSDIFTYATGCAQGLGLIAPIRR